MIIKDMTITNSRGDSITFGHHFRLHQDFELSGLSASVNYSKSTVDGSRYQNTKLKNKDFDIPFFIHKTITKPWWIEEQRDLAYKVFNPKTNPFRIDIITKAGEKYFINANLEGAPSFLSGFQNDNSSWLKGLLQFSSNDPFFYTKDEFVDIASWKGAFSFPLNIPTSGIRMGYRTQNLIANAINTGQVDTGMIVTFQSWGYVKNPGITNVKTTEKIKLNFNMNPGDAIEVSTYTGKKKITLIRDNERISIFNAITLDSTFMQLNPGDNLISYEADEGVNELDVSLIYTPRLLGV